MMAWLWILLAAGVLVETVLLALVMHAEHPPLPERADVLIVLGARVRQGKPSHTLQMRLDAAADAHRRSLGGCILVSGGKRYGDPVDEAKAMAQYLIGHGIDERHILLEAQSRRTSENLRYCLGVMRENRLRSAIIVTSGYHIFRARWQARALGLRAAFIAAPTAAHLRWYGRFRETIAIVKYLLLRS